MVKTKINIYLHLILALLLVPVVVYGNESAKLLVMLYGGWLVFKRDAGALPALAIIATFLSQIYILIFVIIFISVADYKKIKFYRVHYLLIILLLFLPFVLVQSGIRMFVLGYDIGLALNQYQLYFSMYFFFYGILIMNTFDVKVLKAIFISLVLLFFLSFINQTAPDFPLVRLTFFIIPFFAAFILYLIFKNRNKHFIVYFILSIVIISLSIIQIVPTFTLYLTALFSFLLVLLYFSKRHNILIRATGLSVFIVLFLILFYVINRLEDHDYGTYADVTMREVYSFESFIEQFRMKMFEDRAPIWASVWEEIIVRKIWLPPIEVANIHLTVGRLKGIELEFHSHNIFLEFLRSYGIIMGIIVSVVLIKMSLLSRKIFALKGVDKLFIVFVAAAISTLTIGGFTGIYFLLSTYAPLGLSILGISYAAYKDPTNCWLVMPYKYKEINSV